MGGFRANGHGNVYYGGKGPPVIGHSGVMFHSDVDTLWLAKLVFMENVEGPSLVAHNNFNIKRSSLEFIDLVAGIVAGVAGAMPALRGMMSHHLIISVPTALHVSIMIEQPLLGTQEDYNNYTVEIAGRRDMVQRVDHALRERFDGERLPVVDWWFQEGPHTRSKTIIMPAPPPVYDAFYPFLDGPVEDFIDRYLADSASILFLMGKPGTGKTSLVRHMVYTRHLNARLTYDEELLERDGFFVDFMTNPGKSLLVIEDADTLLTSRESTGNQMVSRFLNVSDGLIKPAGKKVIFTTNLHDFSQVDPALIRPGRCFGNVQFRALTASEADDAAIAAGLPAPGRPLTLAELFNTAHNEPQLRRIGF